MIERVTHNYRRIKRIVPEWSLLASPKIYYLVEREQDNDVGVIVFLPVSDKLVVHVFFKKSHRGKKAAAAIRQAFLWIYENTDHTKITARISVDHRSAHVLARNVGMMFNGIEEDLFRCYCCHKMKRAA